MEETEKTDEDSKNEKIIDQSQLDEIMHKKDTLDINYEIKERNKYKNISDKNKENNNKLCNTKNIKKILKIIFCPCYCIFFKSFEWIWDGRCEFEDYYKSYSFLENILFCILSIIDILAISFYKDNLSNAFFIIRIMSDCFGIIIFWLSIVLYDEESADENNFESGLLLFTLISLGLMGLFDIFSFVVFCSSNSDFNAIILICFLIHLILSIAYFSFNICKFLH